jgi:transposase-like protein
MGVEIMNRDKQECAKIQQTVNKDNKIISYFWDIKLRIFTNNHKLWRPTNSVDKLAEEARQYYLDSSHPHFFVFAKYEKAIKAYKEEINDWFQKYNKIACELLETGNELIDKKPVIDDECIEWLKYMTNDDESYNAHYKLMAEKILEQLGIENDK